MNNWLLILIKWTVLCCVSPFRFLEMDGQSFQRWPLWFKMCVNLPERILPQRRTLSTFTNCFCSLRPVSVDKTMPTCTVWWMCVYPLYWPSIYTKLEFLTTINWAFWYSSPRWIYLETCTLVLWSWWENKSFWKKPWCVFQPFTIMSKLLVVM